MMQKIKRQGSRHRGGQSLVEFAIVVPWFMLMLGGVIQFGLWFWDQNTLTQVVRDAGRFAATVTDCSSTTVVHDKTVEIENQTPFSGQYGAITVTLPSSGTPCPPTNNTQAVFVTIKADATMPVFFPLVNGNISSQATFRMEPKTQ
jgi:Flp pilus assembly protein TadG